MFTDTNRLMYEIETANFYEDFYKDKEWLAFSKYITEHDHKCQKAKGIYDILTEYELKYEN